MDSERLRCRNPWTGRDPPAQDPPLWMLRVFGSNHGITRDGGSGFLLGCLAVRNGGAFADHRVSVAILNSPLPITVTPVLTVAYCRLKCGIKTPATSTHPDGHARGTSPLFLTRPRRQVGHHPRRPVKIIRHSRVIRINHGKY